MRHSIDWHTHFTGCHIIYINWKVLLSAPHTIIIRIIGIVQTIVNRCGHVAYTSSNLWNIITQTLSSIMLNGTRKSTTECLCLYTNPIFQYRVNYHECVRPTEHNFPIRRRERLASSDSSRVMLNKLVRSNSSNTSHAFRLSFSFSFPFSGSIHFQTNICSVLVRR